MNRVDIVSLTKTDELKPAQLDDFSHFKEKVIMIKALKSLASNLDSSVLRSIIDKEGKEFTYKKLKRALKSIVDEEIKRIRI